MTNETKQEILKPLSMLGGGGAIGALLVFSLSTLTDTNQQQHDVFNARLAKMELDITELKIQSAKQGVNFNSIALRLEKIDIKLEKIMEKK